ncbi:hypothetical protein OZX73_03610 [Bifidobacterium sp. ESL0775]|uniref:hypothetical protein n=1 Tax=Bifidobacterium sp. ESL0775 TaxID=2983230 RepID=UPI0023F9145B|nr:hypothetical protein [Bifidobacterium sp. ESL0775]WEV69958.1 hypothetical protein OZX73_03610 [Bifidobacterium sp. ESL0775]
MDNTTNPPLPSRGGTDNLTVPLPSMPMPKPKSEPIPKPEPELPAELVAMEQKVMNDKSLDDIDDDSKKAFVIQLYQLRQQEKEEKAAKEKQTATTATTPKVTTAATTAKETSATKETKTEKSDESVSGAPKKKHHSVGAIILYVVYGLIASAVGIALLVYSDGDTTGIIVGLALLAYGLWVFSGAFTGGWRPIFYIVG